MTVDLVIKNGKLVLEKGIIENGAVAIEDGKIVSVTKSARAPKANRTIDAQDNLTMPGTIDPHVHLRSEWQSETSSASVGGTTFVIDHTLGPLRLILPEGFKEKIKSAEGKAIVDFGIHSGIIPNEEVIKAIPEIVKLGAVTFKMVTMGYPPRFPEVDDETMFEAMEAISAHSGIASIHAENKGIVEAFIKKMKSAGRSDPLAHPESRPSFAEGESVTSAIEFSEFTDCPLYIAHVSTREAVDAIRKGKRRYAKVSAETCPQYLLFTTEDMKKLGPYLKFNPPTRSKEHVQALWSGLKSGTIETIGTDHSIFYHEEKDPGWKDIWAASPGSTGVATKTPLMLTKGVLEGRISLQRFLYVCCINPAKILGFYPKKGALLSGSDADIIIVDIKKKQKVTLERCKTKSESTPYDGWELTGWPKYTLVRGTVVYENGEVVGNPGFGKYIPRQVAQWLSTNRQDETCSHVNSL